MEQLYEEEKAFCDKFVNYLEGLYINVIYLLDFFLMFLVDKEFVFFLVVSMFN